jgi:hypothetical protein
VLKREVADLKTNKTKLERYELKRLPPGVYVYALKDSEKGTEADHYACVKCFNEGKIMPMNHVVTFNGMETSMQRVHRGHKNRVSHPFGTRPRRYGL